MEYGKMTASSTAALLLKSCTNTQMFIFHANHDAFCEYLSNIEGLVVALFPSKDSITVSELRQKQGSSLPVTSNTLHSNNQYDAITIIVIDGTWSQAKSMYKLLPANIIKVRLTEAFQSDYGFLRQHEVNEHICSYAAVLHLLTELKEDTNKINTMRSHLNIKIEAFRAQTQQAGEKVGDKFVYTTYEKGSMRGGRKHRRRERKKLNEDNSACDVPS